MRKLFKSGITLVFAGLLASAHADNQHTHNPQDTNMSHSATTVANSYYAAFRGEHAVMDIPMREDLTFVSPRFTLTSAAAFRAALSELFQRVKSLEISDQIRDGETVVTFYELDLGTPGGPIPMAERLLILNGELVEVDLIFDSARLTPPTGNTGG